MLHDIPFYQVGVLDAGLIVLFVALFVVAATKAFESREEQNPTKMKIAKWMLAGFVLTGLHFVAQLLLGFDAHKYVWLFTIILNGLIDLVLVGCGLLLHWKNWA